MAANDAKGLTYTTRPLEADTEEAPGGPSVVILSHGIWRRTFGGDAGILGKTLTLNSILPKYQPPLIGRLSDISYSCRDNTYFV